jgi:sarcosine oxidase subunit delta
MRIPCPHCGERDSREFSYLGGAERGRPDPNRADALVAFISYVYERDNVAGVQEEFWYHGSGCQAWLVVTRDTKSHAISAARSCKAEP